MVLQLWCCKLWWYNYTTYYIRSELDKTSQEKGERLLLLIQMVLVLSPWLLGPGAAGSAGAARAARTAGADAGVRWSVRALQGMSVQSPWQSPAALNNQVFASRVTDSMESPYSGQRRGESREGPGRVQRRRVAPGQGQWVSGAVLVRSSNFSPHNTPLKCNGVNLWGSLKARLCLKKSV